MKTEAIPVGAKTQRVTSRSVLQEIEAQYNLLDDLRGAVQRLEERFESVLLPPLTDNNAFNSPVDRDASPACAIAQALEARNDRIRVITYQIEEITHRVDI